MLGGGDRSVAGVGQPALKGEQTGRGDRAGSGGVGVGGGGGGKELVIETVAEG